MTLSRRGLMLVLNALWTEGVERVTVEHPCAEIETRLEVDLDGAEESTVRIRAGRQSYKSRRETVHLHHGDHAYEDLPDAHTLPGTHRGRSGQRVQHRRDRLVPGAIHPPGFGGRTSAGIDANIFPWRVPTVLWIDSQRPEYDDQRPRINGYALSSGVESELDWQFKQRHSRLPARSDRSSSVSRTSPPAVGGPDSSGAPRSADSGQTDAQRSSRSPRVTSPSSRGTASGPGAVERTWWASYCRL